MLAVRRGAVGALASGDARVRRACGAVRKGARAEAGWCWAPHARAEGFMGVRLRTFWKQLDQESAPKLVTDLRVSLEDQSILYVHSAPCCDPHKLVGHARWHPAEHP